MKFIYTLFSILLLPLLFGCCNSKPANETIGLGQNGNQSGPASIVQNLSKVTARVDEVLFKDETNYQLKATILTVEEINSYPNIAVAGNDYLLSPNFRYDNDNLMNGDINDSLKKLGKLSKGKEFKAEISLVNQKGWLIQKVLSIE